MQIAPSNREDIKAALRKRFGSVAKFERARGLPEKSVSDVLRGSTSRRVTAEIEKALNEPLPPEEQPEFSGDSSSDGAAHRLNAEGR